MMSNLRQGMVLAGTGHRPNRLGGYTTITNNRLRVLAQAAISVYQPIYGYCGGALGWDLAWGEALLGADIPYCLALPWPGMGSNWSDPIRERLDTLKANADKCIYVRGTYSKGAYAIRDKYMVTNAEGVIALLDPDAIDSGTYITCQYAYRLGKPVTNLWDVYQ